MLSKDSCLFWLSMNLSKALEKKAAIESNLNVKGSTLPELLLYSAMQNAFR